LFLREYGYYRNISIKVAYLTHFGSLIDHVSTLENSRGIF
jgi:hypothetical protein